MSTTKIVVGLHCNHGVFFKEAHCDGVLSSFLNTGFKPIIIVTKRVYGLVVYLLREMC